MKLTITPGLENLSIRTSIDLDTLEGMFGYLCGVRESGLINMFGAGPCLEEEFGISKKNSTAVLSYWMANFSKISEELFKN